MTISDFIDHLGGPHRIAKALRAPPTTVASWKARKSIPVSQWPALLKMARLYGLPNYSADTLVAMHKRKQ